MGNFYDRRNLILCHPLFQKSYKKIVHYEKDRSFCRHDMTHFLDVARIAMILNNKEQLQINEDLIYAAALLHDIGRHKQYKNGENHAAASVPIAECIMRDCSFSDEETESIIKAISMHRNEEIKEQADLCGLLYRADKMSRSCFCCKVNAKCSWPEEKKGNKLIY
ncbi:HD domain-containing protein [Pectinatus haikarae]|uniref:HD domain-containing protein n=1 Tax=Pectinatus haikarae TaxID=349096 RepID=UPI0018C64592|nr:HD domain-containing protein [Pectinatus haikarae]